MNKAIPTLKIGNERVAELAAKLAAISKELEDGRRPAGAGE